MNCCIFYQVVFPKDLYIFYEYKYLYPPPEINIKKGKTQVCPASWKLGKKGMTPTLEGVDDVDIEEVKERVLQERLADEARRREERKASGGIAGLSGGIDEGPPPESGPTPHGLPSLMKRGMKI